MNIILATVGSYGDVLPFVHIGVKLKLLGHKVTLLTSEYFREKVAHYGLEFAGFSTKETYEKSLQATSVLGAKKIGKIFVMEMLLPAVEPVYEYIEKQYKNSVENNQNEKTIIMATGFCFGAKIASEKYNIPLITIKLSPVQFRISSDRPKHILFNKFMPDWFVNSVWWLYDSLITDAMVKAPINRFRVRVGLPSVSRILYQWWNSNQRCIGLFPDWFLRIDKHWPADSDLVGFVLPPVNDQELPEAVLRFLQSNPNPIVFTPGTAVANASHFFTVASEIVAELKTSAIFLTKFSESIPNQLPKNILHVDFVAMEKLLPMVGVLVHFGGIGTIAESIRAQVPQLIVPAVNDQFDNAQRIEDLGLGLSVHQNNFSMNTVVPMLQRLITAKEFRNNLLIRGRSISNNNLDSVVDIIDRFMSENC